MVNRSKYFVENETTSVIREIDKRIAVAETIRQLSNDQSIDELHTLHPLVLYSGWLFGAQYDSIMFAQNPALTAAVKGLFKDEAYDANETENRRCRPDMICLKQYSLRAVCTERIDTAVGGIMKPDQILIVEMKRGWDKISDDELSRMEYYVRQMRKSTALHSSATIDAYLVGAELGDVDVEKATTGCHIHATTYSQLVDTASSKLFALRQRIKESTKAKNDFGARY